MDFDKGWGRLQRCLLIVGIIVSIWVSYEETINHPFPFENPAAFGVEWKVIIVISWIPYILARSIRWIVKGFIGNGKKN